MGTVSVYSDKLVWLANEIFAAFPQEASGLSFYTLDCACVYYQRVFMDGSLDPHVGIYRDAENGPCEICMSKDEDWEERVVDEIVVYKSNFQMAEA